MSKSYIDFLDISAQHSNLHKKTKTFVVKNRELNEVIGVIKWHGAWRQYCFFTEGSMLFCKSCLSDISDFIQRLMDDRKQGK